MAAAAAATVAAGALWWWAGSGTAAKGGPFTLIDGNGKVVRDSDFRGRYMLVYFGYTFCPDVCPAALGKLSTVLDRLDKAQLDKLAVLFISVDPERDHGERLADYGKAFHPSIIGLTGSREQIDAAALAYGAQYRFAGDTSRENYAMDHTSVIYVMNPEGKYVTSFTQNMTAEAVLDKLQAMMR